MSSTWWVNGKQVIPIKVDGYLPTTIRLDTANLNLCYGDGGTNLLVVWTDNGASTGWWYEGSGLPRHARIVVTPTDAFLRPFAIAAPAKVTGSIQPRSHPKDGLTAAAELHPTADVSASTPQTVTLTFQLVDAVGQVVATSTTKQSVHGDVTVSSSPLVVKSAELWGVPRPYLYTLVATLATDKNQDSVNTTVGIRELTWDSADGLHVNEQRVKMRGFCNHESFAGVGAAIPPRIDLLRVQQMRGVGGNAWRTSHNPPEPALLDVTDRLGVLVLDENRVFATTTNCPGDQNDPNHTWCVSPAENPSRFPSRMLPPRECAWGVCCPHLFGAIAVRVAMFRSMQAMSQRTLQSWRCGTATMRRLRGTRCATSLAADPEHCLPTTPLPSAPTPCTQSTPPASLLETGHGNHHKPCLQPLKLLGFWK